MANGVEHATIEHVAASDAFAPARAAEASAAGPVELGRHGTFWAMARVGVAMLLADRIKFIGTLVGVVFAVLLSNQQAATFLGLLDKSTMLVRRSGADIWVTPPFSGALQAGQTLPDDILTRARSTPGVAWAAPLLLGNGSIQLPSGATESIQIVGTELPHLRGGPWNIVAGNASDLARPDAMFFEDSERDKLGGLNLGSLREVNGHRVQVAGFTIGLIPFGPSYAFAGYTTARELLHVENHRIGFALIGVTPGHDVAEVALRLGQRLPQQQVLLREALQARIARHVLASTSIGAVMGSGAFFALMVGLIIVSLTMFSAVIDHLREFGTMKALGATDRDLIKLLLAQALTIAFFGWLIGQTGAVLLVRAIGGPKLPMSLPPWSMLVTLLVVVLLCIVSSTLALIRLRKVEPALVFRG